jgi:hypothetical protein
LNAYIYLGITAIQQRLSTLNQYLFTSNNPFAFQGNEAPEDANPSMLRKPGKKRSNPAQFIPWTSKELQGNLDDYHQLQAVFEPLFEWIADIVCLQISSILIFNNILFHQMAKVLPEHTKILQQWVNILPSNEFSPVFPFSGLVINVNVVTRAHRNWEDLSLCLVLEISDCEGGETMYDGTWSGASSQKWRCCCISFS